MSGKIIPFFSATQIQRIEDYEQYYHAKGYIRRKSERYKDSRKPNAELLPLMSRAGYAKYAKFRAHRASWDQCRKDVPLAYLHAIGVDLKVLGFSVSLDREEYDRVSRVPCSPRYFTARLMPTVYRSIGLPDGIGEDEATEMVKRYAAEKGIQCCISITQIKTIWIRPDGRVTYTYFWPAVRYTRTMAVFGSDGSGIGISRLK